MKPIILNSINDLDFAAEKVLTAKGTNRIVCLYGSMGSGKTTLIKSICKLLGVKDNVVSPTFALINEYSSENNEPIFHFDFYRINRLEEVYDFGYEDYFYSTQGICLIEWPELIEEILPSKGVIRFKISVNPNDTRKIELID